MSSTSQKITPHLALLRRFARALAGSQEQGDQCVARVLEDLLSDPAQFPQSDPPRAALYRAFLRTWNSLDFDAIPRGSEGEGSTAAASRTLGAISPKPRQIFLLTAVEGFSTDEAAYILDTDARGAVELLDEAARQIAEQMATDVVIIEDEPLVAMHLEDIVTSLGHRVVAMARTHTEAVKAVAEHRPGLVLADIQLADGSSGLQAVNEILKSKNLPVIFITAFPERLLTGARPEPVFLITKPFRVDAVKAIISQVLFFDTKARASGGRFGSA
ncbi:MAG: response regulator [Bacteroidota bacterium]|jgi:DNA-directed RNA polymerase specialized sigma24 family protein